MTRIRGALRRRLRRIARRLPDSVLRPMMGVRRWSGRRVPFTDAASAAVVARALAAVDAQQGATGRVALVLKVDAVAIANAVAAGLRSRGHRPNVLLLALDNVPVYAASRTVHIVVCRTIEARLDVVARCPRFDLIVERGNNNKGQKLFCFTRLLPFVRDGGSYIVEDLQTVHDPARDDHAGETVLEMLEQVSQLIEDHSDVGREATDLERLADAVGGVEIAQEHALVTKRGHHRLKLREHLANDLLAEVRPDEVTVLSAREATRIDVAAKVTTHGTGPTSSSRRTIDVPARYLREYKGVHAASRQLLFDDLFFFPDTFRHPAARVLESRPIVSVDAWTGRVRDRSLRGPRQLRGHYYYLDTEYPGHFGHVLTEVLSRVPGWFEAEKRFPGIRPLVSLDPGQTEVPEFQKLLFEAAGIDADAIEYISADEVVQIESLVASTPSFVQPHYVAPELRDVWSQVGAALGAEGTLEAKRIFVSRRSGGVRACHDQGSIETFFADEGFTVVYPEDHSFPDQISLFRSAEVIAGFSGSQMFTSMFCESPKQILISSSSYTANNEALIAAITGGSLDIFWGPADVDHPSGSWTWKAFQSEFSFDVNDNAGALRRAIAAR